jgi:hypothetical protein
MATSFFLACKTRMLLLRVLKLIMNPRKFQGMQRRPKQYLEAFVVVGSWDVDGQGEGAKYEGVQLRLEGVRKWASGDASNLPERREQSHLKRGKNKILQL